MNPKVDEFISQAKKWGEEMAALRSIVLECGLTEELKWRQPCYTFQKGNVVIISGFKDYCALNLFKGALLDDPEGILIQPGENTQSGRQIRFTSLQEITEMETILKDYLQAAVEVEKAGLKVNYKATSEYAIPEEFQTMMDENSALKAAFEGLTPGRQRAYLLYFSGAKQSKTRTSRVEKHLARILEGKGLNDR